MNSDVSNSVMIDRRRSEWLGQHSVMVGRRSLLGLLAGSAALLLGACERTDILRYRMTVEVETPTGVRSGSSVIETTITKGPRFGDASGITSKMRGEAVAVDLGNGQTLFALLSNGADRPDGLDESEYHARLLHEALNAGAPASPPMPRKYAAQEWTEERAAARTIRPTIVLSKQLYPTMVRFRDLNRPASVAVVRPDDLSSHFGSGVRIKQVSITVTDDDPEFTIKGRFPWWESYTKKHFDGSTTSLEGGPDRSLPHLLSSYSFSAGAGR